MNPIDDVEQFSGIVTDFENAIVPTLATIHKQADFDFLKSKILQSRVESDTSGAETVFYLGTKTRNIAADHSKELLLHPHQLPLSDRSGDIKAFKAAPMIENVQLIGSRTTEQKVQLNWRMYPDITRAVGQEYVALGNWNLTSSTPLGIFLACNHQVFSPGQHLEASTLIPGQVDRVNAFAIFGSIVGTATAAVNEIGGRTAIDTSIAFDGLSSPNSIVNGDYLTIVTTSGAEIVFVSNVTYITSTTGTLTVIREVGGTLNNDAIADDAVITRIASVSFSNVTDSGGVWGSTVIADVTVGNTYGSTIIKNKPGVLAHVTDGSSNITYTFESVVSPVLTVTATV